MNARSHTQTLGYIADLNPGLPELPADDELVSFLPMAAIDSESIDAVATDVRRFSEVNKGYTPFISNDVLVAKITPCFENGKIAQAKPSKRYGFGSTEFHVVRPDPDRLDARFLVHFLRQTWVRVEGERRMTGSAGQRRIPEHFLRNLTIPLPTLAKQRSIAQILDSADRLRAKRRAALVLLNSLTQSIFIDQFGDPLINRKKWRLVPFPSVVFFQEGPGIRNWQFRNEGIKLINVKNIVEGKLVTGNTDRYLAPSEVNQRYQHFLLDAGDLVIASSGVTWGKIAEVAAEHLPLCLNTSMIRLRPLNGSIEKTFIRAFVESLAFRKQILRLITGSAQPNFGPAHLKQVVMPLPSIVLQRKFARRVAAVEKLKMAQRASLAEMDALFASLEHRAFRGEL